MKDSSVMVSIGGLSLVAILWLLLSTSKPPQYTFTGVALSSHVSTVYGPTGGALGNVTFVGWKLEDGKLWTQTIEGVDISIQSGMHLRVTWHNDGDAGFANGDKIDSAVVIP